MTNTTRTQSGPPADGSAGEPAIVLRPGHLPRSNVNLPDVIRATAQEAVPPGANVVPFTRARTGHTPILTLGAESRPAPDWFPRNRPTLWAGVVAISLLLHSGIYALLVQRPAPLASAGFKAINVELWMGADSVAGAATTAGETQAQQVAAVAPSSVAREVTESDTASERKPATEAPQQVAVTDQETAPVVETAKPKAAIAAKNDLQAISADDDIKTASTASPTKVPAAEGPTKAAAAEKVIQTASADDKVKPAIADTDIAVAAAGAAKPAALDVQAKGVMPVSAAETAAAKASPSTASALASASAAAVRADAAPPQAPATVARPAIVARPAVQAVAANRASMVAPAAASATADAVVAPPAKSASVEKMPAAAPMAQNVAARPAAAPAPPSTTAPSTTTWTRKGSAAAQAAESVPAQKLSALTAPAAAPATAAPERVSDSDPVTVAAAEPEAATVQSQHPPAPLSAPERRRIAAPTANHQQSPHRRVATAASASANGIGRGRSDLYSNYAGLVAAQLARYKRFPEAAWRRGEEGTAVVGFLLDGYGYVRSVTLLRGSGSASIDLEAETMVYRASPFPMPPETRGMRITAPITFRLQ